MKADRIRMYIDMYYSSELPAILERETEQEKKKIKEWVKNSLIEWGIMDKDATITSELFRKMDEL